MSRLLVQLHPVSALHIVNTEVDADETRDRILPHVSAAQGKSLVCCLRLFGDHMTILLHGRRSHVGPINQSNAVLVKAFRDSFSR